MLYPQRPSLDTAYENDPKETFVSHWFADFVDSGRASVRFSVRHSSRTVTMLRYLHRLPQLTISPSASGNGPLVRSTLRAPALKRLVLGNTVSVLPIPNDAAAYTTGRPKHALRQKIRAAERAQLSYRTVTDASERESILRKADDHERFGAVESTRRADADNQDLLPLDLWVVAEVVEGVPLLLAVAAIDGDTSVLRYYRTLSNDETSSLARFGAMPHVVSELHRSGVRWVFEAGRPAWIDNRFRQFQRKVGFRIVRVKVTAPPRERAAQTAAPVPRAATRRSERAHLTLPR